MTQPKSNQAHQFGKSDLFKSMPMKMVGTAKQYAKVPMNQWNQKKQHRIGLSGFGRKNPKIGYLTKTRETTCIKMVILSHGWDWLVVTLMQAQMMTTIPRMAWSRSWPSTDHVHSSSMRANSKLSKLRRVTKIINGRWNWKWNSEFKKTSGLMVSCRLYWLESRLTVNQTRRELTARFGHKGL